MVLLQIAIWLGLAFICYQDIRYRAVYWICFPLLAALLLLLKHHEVSLKESLWDAAYGTGFLCLQLFLLWVYFSIKNKRLVNLTDHYLGTGDVLFLISIAFYLSPANYIAFYIISLVVVLLFVMMNRSLITNHIPLAGLQAALLGFLMLADLWSPAIALQHDNWIYGFYH